MENPHAPQKDESLEITRYSRTLQQEEMLGLRVSAKRGQRNALELSGTLEHLESVGTYFAAANLCILSQHVCASPSSSQKDFR